MKYDPSRKQEPNRFLGELFVLIKRPCLANGGPTTSHSDEQEEKNTSQRVSSLLILSYTSPSAALTS